MGIPIHYRSVSSIVFRFAAIGAAALSVCTAKLSAQAVQGNWGAEGRVGSGQAAYLIRWFSPAWSVLLGGSTNAFRSTRENSDFENSAVSGNIAAVIRREGGSGRVHPMIGVGPLLNFTRVSQTNPPSTVKSTITSASIGARVELGAVASVSDAVGLGIVAGGEYYHNTQKARPVVAGPNQEDQTLNAFSLGNPQFVVRVRF